MSPEVETAVCMTIAVPITPGPHCFGRNANVYPVVMSFLKKYRKTLLVDVVTGSFDCIWTRACVQLVSID